jgi:hypothetical protein
VPALAFKLAKIGWVLLILDLTIFAGAMISLIVYVVRRGKSNEEEGKVITTSDVIGSVDPTIRGFSKEKVLVSRSKFVSMESLVNGTASKQDVRFAIAITVALISFSLIFACVALINLPSQGPGVLLFMVVPIGMGWSMWKSMYKDYREAKKKGKLDGRNGPSTTRAAH